jgi:hypothetical protein
LSTAAAAAQDQPLFKIERNKNANIVQYDARLGDDGRLHPKKPVAAYWIRLADDGQRKDLNWMQRRFAYGFKAKVDRDADTAELDMVADIQRPITVVRHADGYRAWTEISGSSCLLDKLFIHSKGSGLGTKVNYIEFHGTDKHSGETCFEKLEP